MPGEDAELDVLNAFDEEDLARARSMAEKFGIDFDAPPANPRRQPFRHPHLNNETTE